MQNIKCWTGLIYIMLRFALYEARYEYIIKNCYIIFILSLFILVVSSGYL